ncbi:MAG: hypothetical protein WCS03_05940 [Bacteroidota bacterium]
MIQIKSTGLLYIFIGLISICLLPIKLYGQYVTMRHKIPVDGEVPVSEAGNYDIPGTTYILVNDIKGTKSALFLGKDITLDLNGYTITYADGEYEHIPNSSFEEGLNGWDMSKAPAARIEDTKVHVFIGNNILRLKAGEEITSPYINLPVAYRSYFAFCGVCTWDMRVSVYVEDDKGTSLTCITKYADSTMVSCPIENRSPRLGGGFVYAHINGLPAGKYRVRVRAETDCLVDYIDIRPAMDAGIGIVEETHPMGHNDHLYKRAHGAFFDYTANVADKTPMAGIPVVKGSGSVVIKNGVIRNATPCILSWGIQSTAENVHIVLENLKIITAGINSTAADVPQATITNCTFEVDNPFIINRHGAEFYAVDLTGEKPSEVAFSEFYGGQGCLSFKGNFSRIHHNYFVNKQTVTNHYSIMAMGDSSQIFDNRIEPEIGSGIEVYVHRGMQIFNNVIRISAAPPTCEYGHEDYSTAAVRIADYKAKPGSPDGCFGNKVYNNKIFITGKDYPEYTDYIPMAWAVFYSASAGDNYIFGNQIEVNDQNPGSKNETSAFYIGGGTAGGQFFNNHITANVPAVWVASRYGGAKDTRIFNNQFTKSRSAGNDFKAIRIGWSEREDCVAENIRFESNNVEGDVFGIDATDQTHSYSVYWTLTINLRDKSGRILPYADIVIMDKGRKEVLRQKTDKNGYLRVDLPEYSVEGDAKTESSPYKILAGKKKIEVELKKNEEINLVIK